MARNFLQLIEELGEEDSKQREAVVEFFPYSFEFVGQKSTEYLQVQKRFSYSTPKSFLELIKLYIAMPKNKFCFLDNKQERLANGLEKLRVTQVRVAQLDDELKEKAVVVQEKAPAADVFAEEVGKEKAKVNAEAETANVEAAKCGQIARNVSIQQKSCEEDLAAAIPLV